MKCSTSSLQFLVTFLPGAFAWFKTLESWAHFSVPILSQTGHRRHRVQPLPLCSPWSGPGLPSNCSSCGPLCVKRSVTPQFALGDSGRVFTVPSICEAVTSRPDHKKKRKKKTQKGNLAVLLASWHVSAERAADLRPNWLLCECGVLTARCLWTTPD